MSAVLGLTVGTALFSVGPSGAQFASGNEPAACSAGSDCSASTFTATVSTGTAITISSVLDTAIDLGPGAHNSLGTNVSGDVLLGPEGDASTRVKVGDTFSISGNGNMILTNGAALFNGTTTIYNQTSGKGIAHDAAFGIEIAKKTLGTCASGHESPTAIVSDAAAGGTTGSLTRLCFCASDGAGTPAYSWRNLGCPGTAGTATTCPACP